MTTIFKINSVRFYKEYQNHIQQDRLYHVNWYVDSKLILHMYIITDRYFGFYYATPSDSIPSLIQSIISQDGETFGILEGDIEDVKISDESLDKLRRNLTTYKDTLA